MISFAEAIAQCAEHIANHDNHGYSQPNRKGYGTEHCTFSDGTEYDIHYGDYDCSEMARMCAEAAGLLSPDVWMWTGNEDEVLTDAGFSVVSLLNLRRGDILFKSGHTGIYLGGSLMADAHGDEVGGINGPSQGDQTGHEIEIRNVWSCSWVRAYRPPEGHLGALEEVSSDPISRGVDISNNDGFVKVSDIDCGFIIAKVSEGDYFEDTYCSDNLKQSSECGKLYGMYHFANNNSAIDEAEWFVRCAERTGYLDGATLWLDYEADALANGPEWAEKFMQHVDELTGKTCGIYMSQSVCVEQDWSKSCHRPLWVAEVSNYKTWTDEPWSSHNYGAWGTKCAIHQYSWDGYVAKDGQKYDIDKGYFTKEQWAAWATGTTIDTDDKEDAKDGDYFKMASKTVKFRETVNIRTAPSTHADIVGQYFPEETCIIDGMTIAEGYSWGHYIGSQSGADRYFALGKTSFVD